MSSPRKLRYAMVGGGHGAFIGAVHRKAMALDGQFELVAGALSSSPERARASGAELGLADDRNHGSWQDLLADELRRPAHERIDLVSIVTPNHMHHPVALAFVQAGFHVVCDKPLVHTRAQADELVAAVKKAGTVFGVTYNYTGQRPAWVCADLTTFGAGRQLDDDAQLLLRYDSGARGFIVASQVAAGLENDLRLQVSGTLGTITWRQEEPNQLVHSPVDGPRRILTRGSPWLCESARRAGRIPAGHPEAFIEAFANIYLGVAADIRARAAGRAADPLAADYPRVEDR